MGRLLVAACAVSTSIAASAGVPNGCNLPVWEGASDVQQAYSERSVKIVGLAARGDVRALEALVSPSATFVVWHGDSGAGRETGARGAVEFAKRLGAGGFQSVILFSMIASNACGKIKVTLQFHGADGERAHDASFTYSKGRLVEATAGGGSLFKGRIGPD